MALAEIARAVNAAGVAWSASYDAVAMQSDRELQSELEERALAALVVHDAPAIAPEESAAARSAAGPGYRAFGPYFDTWWDLPIASHEYPLLLRFAASEIRSESLPRPQEFGGTLDSIAAGPAVARRCFERFMRERAAGYAPSANVPAADRTSHLSAHLSLGSISARTIARAVREQLSDPFALSEERLALRLFLRAVAHRDFFLQLSWFHPWTQDEPLQEKMRGFRGNAGIRHSIVGARAHRIPARRRGNSSTPRDRLDASARPRGCGILALLRYGRRLARRS